MFTNKLSLFRNISNCGKNRTKFCCTLQTYVLEHKKVDYTKKIKPCIILFRRNSQTSASKVFPSCNSNIEVNSYTYRSHTCGDLKACDAGKKVILCGWVQFLRMSKFLLLRDSYGLIQCVVSDSFKDFLNVPLESVVKIEGTVVSRPKDMINKEMTTGEIEVVIERFQLLNSVENLPFNLKNYQKPKEQLRMQHRYIDLRFPEMQYNLRQRSLMLHNVRKFLVENKGFVEVETPTLFCRTPGGAREFIVPTRHSQLFYSLVQSPQQFKQMLMVGGVDRYFQVARCYRDETTRPDRQPEFTQLDIEVSFTNSDGILSMIEDLLYNCYLKPIIQPPFKRMSYRNALELYGTDKPDLTFDLTLKNITKLFSNKSTSVYLLPYPKELGKFTAKTKDIIKQLMKKYKNVKIILNENICTEFGIDLSKNIIESIGNDEYAVVALGDRDETCLCLGELRCVLATLLQSKNLLESKDDVMEPLWIIDFPLFVKGEDGSLETCHHPFTAPHPDDIHLLEEKPHLVRSLAYDLVMNGNEIGGGSVRIHDAILQEKILGILNIDSKKLSHFISALRSGCPPHAGIALGIDRLMAVMCNAESIRDVIAFPKSHEGKDPLSGAPNVISEEEKQYYHIKTVE